MAEDKAKQYIKEFLKRSVTMVKNVDKEKYRPCYESVEKNALRAERVGIKKDDWIWLTDELQESELKDAFIENDTLPEQTRLESIFFIGVACGGRLAGGKQLDKARIKEAIEAIKYVQGHLGEELEETLKYFNSLI